MTKLSVNINKIATLRNSRGGNVPSVTQVAIDVQKIWSSWCDYSSATRRKTYSLSGCQRFEIFGLYRI